MTDAGVPGSWPRPLRAKRRKSAARLEATRKLIKRRPDRETLIGSS
jgi:hypothetical protein